KISGMVDFDGQHMVLRARADRCALDRDIADAVAAFNAQHVFVERISGERINEIDEQGALTIRVWCRRIIHHLEEINPVKGRVIKQCLTAALVTTEVDHRHSTRMQMWSRESAPPFLLFQRMNVAVRRVSLRRTRYWTVMCKVESSLPASTASTSIRSPSHCCNAPCTRNCVVAASSSLLGAKTNCIIPLPKSGRLTRSPGAVKSTCSIRSRMCASSSIDVVRPRPSKWYG